MRRPKPIDLDVVRAKREPPHVRVQIELWYLGNGRWWYEPETVGRMEINQHGRDLVGRCIAEYGAEFAAWKRPMPKGRRVKRRRGRR
ncbi:hypothetical protein LBMAG42_57500 [Deltaproteobacteria bacterium]|nr:hypothetical protein LBMAG42_57500 [Deltaproteobacteria bacterium]